MKKEIDVDKIEQKWQEQLEKEPLEKGDLPAMIIAAVIVAIPVLLLCGGIVLLAFWLMM
ncbi:MAG: hypothetical protein R3Y63_04305 [Eubacteriales bacterium]